LTSGLAVKSSSRSSSTVKLDAILFCIEVGMTSASFWKLIRIIVDFPGREKSTITASETGVDADVDGRAVVFDRADCDELGRESGAALCSDAPPERIKLGCVGIGGGCWYWRCGTVSGGLRV